MNGYAGNNLDEFQVLMLEKKPDSKGYILYDSMCKTCWEMQN